MSLILALNEAFAHSQEPDQIVNAVCDPLAKPISIEALGFEQFKRLHGRQVYYLLGSVNSQRWVNDSGEEGEPLEAASGWFCEDGTFRYPGANWKIVSAEAFQTLDLSTLEPPS